MQEIQKRDFQLSNFFNDEGPKKSILKKNLNIPPTYRENGPRISFDATGMFR